MSRSYRNRAEVVLSAAKHQNRRNEILQSITITTLKESAVSYAPIAITGLLVGTAWGSIVLGY